MSKVEKVRKLFFRGVLNWQEAYNELTLLRLSEKDIIEAIGTLQEYRNAAGINSEN